MKNQWMGVKVMPPEEDVSNDVRTSVTVIVSTKSGKLFHGYLETNTYNKKSIWLVRYPDDIGDSGYFHKLENDEVVKWARIPTLEEIAADILPIDPEPVHKPDEPEFRTKSGKYTWAHDLIRAMRNGNGPLVYKKIYMLKKQCDNDAIKTFNKIVSLCTEEEWYMIDSYMSHASDEWYSTNRAILKARGEI